MAIHEEKTTKKNVYYRVVITEVNMDTGEEKQMMDDNFTAIDMVADDFEEKGRMCEVMLNDNIHNAAIKLANAHKLRSAVRLASAFMSMHDDSNSFLEGMLSDMLASNAEGGVQ